MKILIIQQKMIGDVLTSSILFEALKKKYPKSELHYLINSHTYPVVENNPFIDKFIFFTPEMEKNKLKFYGFLKSIRREKYDAIVDVYGKLSSALITLFAKAKIKSAYYKKHTSFIFSNTFKRLTQPVNNASLAVENRLKLLEPLKVEFTNISTKIYLKNDEIETSRHFLETHKIDLTNPLFMISVLGSTQQKTYPLNYIAELIDVIAEYKNSQILFNYIPKQEVDARKVYNYCKASTQKKIFFNVYGKSLREFLAITKHCSALIGNEGGANNMAKALNIPTFTIFSPYLNKKNWFGEVETKTHVAIHLSDFIKFNEVDRANAKQNPEAYYLKLEPNFIKPQLNSFLSTLDKCNTSF
ncbi:glycosyltransferase family 9 protein [uncultured Algibacter sp.]|uniref:glycosyltransferase family 9 protein n=1 Tax=uncultured Algibacter sp. TaxID=298659 RepID=UPI0030EF5422|tara:strand:- start:1569 stop:2639 length:1071 start_codon:yes stop_codon:yes gene_type:complete